MWGVGCEFWGLGFEVWGMGCRVWIVGYAVWGVECALRMKNDRWKAEFVRHSFDDYRARATHRIPQPMASQKRLQRQHVLMCDRVPLR